MCMAWLSSLPHLSSCRWTRCWQQGSAGSLLLPLGVCLQPWAAKRCCAELLDVMGTQQTKFLLPFSQEVSFASLKSGGGRDVLLLTLGFSVEDLGACKQPCCWLLPSALLFLLKRVKSVVLQQTWKKGKMFFLSISYMLSMQL